jgi:hypothetical protein
MSTGTHRIMVAANGYTNVSNGNLTLHRPHGIDFLGAGIAALGDRWHGAGDQHRGLHRG